MIKRMEQENIREVSYLGNLLWKEASREELEAEFRQLINSETNTVYLYFFYEIPIGFIHVSLRSEYVEGTTSSPVGYIEGIFVLKNYRKQFVGLRLFNAACNWAKEHGAKEIASDCELDNEDSILFHKRIGFEEVNRIVCFKKDL
ncbi:MAG: aminoglycoside 6'-N-acetyltransferase [Bacilli bacterium]